MKNKIIYLFVTIIMLFSSCDEVLDYEYYVVNNNKDSIIVVFENKEINTNWKCYEHKIAPKNNKMIYQTSNVVKAKSTFDDECVKNTFNSLNIYSELGDTAKVNFINDNLWVKEKISKRKLKCTLYVDSLSFN